MDSSEKVSLSAIGKYGKIRCFTNLFTLAVSYESTKKAGCNVYVFESGWNNRTIIYDTILQNVYLIWNNYNAHLEFPNLQARKMICLLHITTAC